MISRISRLGSVIVPINRLCQLQIVPISRLDSVVVLINRLDSVVVPFSKMDSVIVPISRMGNGVVLISRLGSTCVIVLISILCQLADWVA